MEESLTLHVDSLAYGGDSVARTPEGEVVFVRGGCPGDVVRARVVSDRGRFLRAQVAEVLEPSPDRVAAPCPYFGVCGGCQWQHVAYARQADAKHDAVADALQRIGGVDPALVAPTLPAIAQYGYRNKIELTVGRGAGGRAGKAAPLTLGYSALGSEEHVPVEECLLPPERWRTSPKALTGALRYLGAGDDLGVGRVALRMSTLTRTVEVALWAQGGAFPRKRAAGVLTDAVKADSVTRVVVKGDPKERRVSNVEVLSGRGAWRERLGETEFLVSSPSFFQVNTAMAVRLVDLVRERVAATGSDRVLDVYAGVGTFTLALAADAGEIVAVEASGPAVRDLRRNIERSGLDVEVAPGDAAMVVPDLGHVDVAVVDPPRAGLGEPLVSALAAASPSRVVYVSCDPATLARDAKRLAHAGFVLTSAEPVDLFPQTYHVETVAVFQRPQT